MEQLITIGKIGAPHGVRGEVRVTPLTDFPDRFEGLKQVLLETGTLLDVENVRYQNQFIVLKFKGMDCREDIDTIKGKLLKVKRSEVPPLDEGEYYSFDIVGLDVYTDEDIYLGKVKEILKTGSNDVYIVQEGSGVQHLVPALKKVVLSIDLASSRMQVKLQEEKE